MLMNDYVIMRPKSTKIQPRNEIRYVYQVVSSTYNSEKKYNVDKRVCIGKMIDEFQMVPNEKFLEFYPNLIMSEVEPPTFSDTLKIGAFTLIRKIIKDLQIDLLLNEIHGDDATLMINIICYMIVNETSTFQMYPKFMRYHSILGDKIRSDSYISKFLSNDLSEEDIHMFLDAWNTLNKGVENIYIGYDSTNINTAAKGISMAEFGHAKDNDELPQVNLSYVINQEDATPLFYELYPGSINDNSQCRYMVEKAKEYGYKKIGFLLDRGYFSKANIKYFDDHNYDFIMMVKENGEMVKAVMDETRAKLKNMAGCFIAEHRVCGVSVKSQLYADDKTERYFHVYYDDVRASEGRLYLLSAYSQMEKELNKKIESKLAVEGELVKYKKAFRLKYDSNKYLMGYRKNEEYIKAQIEKVGYFVIITSAEMDAEKALDIYRDRDSIEKLFRNLKSGLDYAKFGVHSETSMKAKTHITFIANIVRNQLFQKLKNIKKGNRKDYTVPSVLAELENIECSRNQNGKYMRRYAITAMQKKILKEFDVDEKYIDGEISELC